MKQFENLPESVITLGGDWERTAPSELSLETQLKTLALGVLSIYGSVESAVLSGGLKNPFGNVEAPAMQTFLEQRFLVYGLDIILDTNCHDTRSSAQSVARLPGILGRRHTLITTKNHMPRAYKTFQAEGIDVVPLTAETVLEDSGISPYAETAKRYQSSFRYYKWYCLEAAMRAILQVDRNGMVSRWAAGSVRADRITDTQIQPRVTSPRR